MSRVDPHLQQMKLNSYRCIIVVAAGLCLAFLAALMCIPDIRSGPTRDAPSFIRAYNLGHAVADYIRDTGQIPPTDNRLSRILFDHFQDGKAFIPVDSEGYMLDGNDERMRVIIDEREVIVQFTVGKRWKELRVGRKGSKPSR